MRCCDNCTPRLFEIERVTIEKAPALKRGKKRKLPSALPDAIRRDLSDWRDKELLEKVYGQTSLMTGSALLGDDVIEKLASCGERVETKEEFAQHARWPLGFGIGNSGITDYGTMLLNRLKSIYSKFDDNEDIVTLQSQPAQVDAQIFYAGPSNQPRSRTTLTANTYLQQGTPEAGVQSAQNIRARGEGGRGRSQANRASQRGGRATRRHN
jgi:hypothetical protein